MIECSILLPFNRLSRITILQKTYDKELSKMYCAEPLKSNFSLGLGVCVYVGGGKGGVASHTKLHTKHFDLIFC